MKKLLLAFCIITISLLFFSCSEEEIQITKKYYSTGAVFSGTINIQDSYVGYVEGQDMIDLAPKVGGRITDIFVEEGSYVKKGDILVKLDSFDAKIGYSTAENIINSLYSVKSSTESMFNEQLSAMESKLQQLKLGEQGLKDGLLDTINISNAQLETVKVGVETAKANLDHTKLILKTKEKNIYDNSKNAIVSAIILDTNIVYFIDELLGVTKANKDKNNSIEEYLGAKNTSYKKESELKFRELNILYKEYKVFYDNNIEGKNPDRETILKGLSQGVKVAEKIKEALNSLYSVLDNSIENYYFTIDTINNYKKTVSDFGNYVESSLLTVAGDYTLGLKGSSQSLIDFEQSSLLQITLLEKELNLAEKTFEQYQIINNGRVREVSTQSNIASSGLNEIIAGLEALKKQKELKLKEIDINIKEIEGQKNSAGVMIDAGIIKSPIDGFISSRNAEVGQVIGAGFVVLAVSNESKLELKILISENQSKNIVLNNKVLIEIEGFDKYFSGIITHIRSSKDLITKKVLVEISLENIGKDIKIGSYAKVIFDNNNNGIIIPNSAIIAKFMIPGVYVIENGKSKFKNIDIIKQNDNFSEISGLTVGEILITQGKDNIWDGEKLINN